MKMSGVLMWQDDMTLGELLRSRASENPGRPALFCNDEHICYRELDESSTRLAQWFIYQGFQDGERIAIHWSNSIQVVELFFAIFKAGLTAVPVNLRLKAPEVAWILEHSQAAVCFSEPALAPVAEQAASACASPISIRTEIPGPPHAAQTLPRVHAGLTAAIL